MNGPDSILQRGDAAAPQTEAPQAEVSQGARNGYMELRAQDLTCEAIDPATLPEPYKQLLHHRRAMTPTLEGFFGQPVRVDVLAAKTVGDNYVRKILMKTEDGQRICEWAIIWIALSRFGDSAREAIFQGGVPFGRILADCGIAFRCEPVSTFTLTPDAAMQADLGLGPETQVLYGRRNQILDREDHLLADAIEVLPPLETSAS